MIGLMNGEPASRVASALRLLTQHGSPIGAPDAGLDVPEVWVFDRETREPELYVLAAGPDYRSIAPGNDGWIRRAASGIEFRQTLPGLVWIPIDGDNSTLKEIGDM
jgi:hypothetical protein